MYESKGYLPFSVARNLKILLNKNIENLKSLQFDYNLMKMIKIKIQDNNLVVAEANKNKTVVVLQKHNYDDKVYTFVWAIKFVVINSNPVFAYYKRL